MGRSNEAVRRYFRAANDLMATEKRMADIFRISRRFAKCVAVEYIDEKDRIRKITYGEYAEECRRYAALIHASVLLEKGSVVALKYRNCPDWGEVFWGLLMSGFVPVLIDARAGEDFTRTILTESGARALVGEDATDYRIVRLDPAVLRASGEDPAYEPDWANEVVFCSSGTTGKPKLLVFDGECMCAQIASALKMPESTKDIMYPPAMGNLKNLALLPYHHIFGFVAVFLWYTFFGKTIVYPKNILPNTVLSTCRRLRVTHIYAVPLLWNTVAQTLKRTAAGKGKKFEELFGRMVKYHTNQLSKKSARFGASKTLLKKLQNRLLGPQVRFCISGGGNIPPETLEIINGVGYPLYNGYGMTEVGVVAVELSPSPVQRMKGSIGKPLYGVEFKIDYHEGNNKEGELLIRSGTLFRERIEGGRRVSRAAADPDGWFRTNDVVASDENGFYYIKGRLTDMIVNADGENIFPDEIEMSFQNLPLIAKTAVLGVPTADGRYQRVMLFVEPERELTEAERLDLGERVNRRNGTLPFCKQVEELYLSHRPLPLTNTMKVKKFELLADFRTQPFIFERISLLKSNALISYSEADIAATTARIKRAFAEVLTLKETEITDYGHFVHDYGGDSLTYAELLVKIESEFNLTVADSDYGRLFSVNDFLLMIMPLLFRK